MLAMYSLMSYHSYCKCIGQNIFTNILGLALVNRHMGHFALRVAAASKLFMKPVLFTIMSYNRSLIFTNQANTTQPVVFHYNSLSDSSADSSELVSSNTSVGM